MKKLIWALVIALAAPSSLWALPNLQLYIDGATWDYGYDSWVTYETTFDLYVVGQEGMEDVIVSMALCDMQRNPLPQSYDPAAARVNVDGVFYPEENWTWGYAPIIEAAEEWNASEDLPKHSIYPTWYTEFEAGSFWNAGGIGNTVPDLDYTYPEPFWLPTDGYLNDPEWYFPGEYRKFTITTSGLMSVHFDAYTLNPDGSIEYFAPFSHDATAFGGIVIPEPSALILFGAGLVGVGLVTRRRLKKD